MSRFEIETPAGPEHGVRVRCLDHDTTREFLPGYRAVSFYCPDCDLEVTVDLRDADDWRDLGEWC